MTHRTTSARLTVECMDMLDKLSTSTGYKVSISQIVEKAIRDLYEKEIGWTEPKEGGSTDETNHHNTE